MDVGTLFLTGFLSSALFGTFLGIYVDRWGRRFGCHLFCLLEVILSCLTFTVVILEKHQVAINILEHFAFMPLLLTGRVLGGLSTNLLFSSFESWMVSEHRKRGYPEELLASTFAISSWGNGIMAIIAGLLAQVSAGKISYTLVVIRDHELILHLFLSRRGRGHWPVSTGHLAYHNLLDSYIFLVRELWSCGRSSTRKHFIFDCEEPRRYCVVPVYSTAGTGTGVLRRGDVHLWSVISISLTHRRSSYVYERSLPE